MVNYSMRVMENSFKSVHLPKGCKRRTGSCGMDQIYFSSTINISQNVTMEYINKSANKARDHVNKH